MARKTATQIDMLGNRITNLGSPSDTLDAVTKEYVDDAIASKADNNVTYTATVDDESITQTDTVANWISNLLTVATNLASTDQTFLDDLTAVKDKIPSAASSTNQLADKTWVEDESKFVFTYWQTKRISEIEKEYAVSDVDAIDNLLNAIYAGKQILVRFVDETYIATCMTDTTAASLGFRATLRLTDCKDCNNVRIYDIEFSQIDDTYSCSFIKTTAVPVFEKAYGSAVSVTLALGKVIELENTSSTSITVTMPPFTTTYDGSPAFYGYEKVQEAVLRFSTGTTAPTVTFPAGIRWANGIAPTIEASTYYEISAVYSLGGWNVICQGFKTA